MAGRPPLPLGTWGSVSYSGHAGAWRARARFRDHDGITRSIHRTRATKGAARDALVAALTERSATAGEDLTSDSRLTTAVTLWIEDRERAGLADNTLRRYREVADDHVRPALGEVRLRECTVPRLDRFIRSTTDNTGAATARLARTVISGTMGLAVRYGALTANPASDLSPIARAPRDPSILTDDEIRTMRKALTHWQRPTNRRGRPRTLPLLDVVDVMLATGARIGEALALRWCDVDLEAGTVLIAGTVAFTDTKPSRPFRQEHPKTSSSLRLLSLPPHAVALFTRRRITAPGNDLDLVFPTDTGTVRDPSNLRTKLRAALEPVGLERVTPHMLRRTVATRIDAVSTTRHAADQLGHADESTARRHYVAKAHTGPDVRAHLQGLFE